MKFSVVAVYYRLLKEIVFFLFIFIIDRSNNFEGSKTKNRRIFEKKKKKTTFRIKKKKKNRISEKNFEYSLATTTTKFIARRTGSSSFWTKGFEQGLTRTRPGNRGYDKRVGSVAERNTRNKSSDKMKYFRNTRRGRINFVPPENEGRGEGWRGRGRKKLIRAGRIN